MDEKLLADFNENKEEYTKIVHGKWIWSTDNYGDSVCNCSVCKEELPSVMIGRATFDNPYPETEYIEETNYCPNCGAKMI